MWTLWSNITLRLKVLTPTNGSITLNGGYSQNNRFRVGSNVTVAASADPGYSVAELHVSSEEDSDQPNV